jgi:hypothetical protein
LKEKKKKKLPKLEEFLQSRDYVGAITLIEVLYSVPCLAAARERERERERERVYALLYSFFVAPVRTALTMTNGWLTAIFTMVIIRKPER